MKTIQELHDQWSRIVCATDDKRILNKAWRAKCNEQAKVCEALHVPKTIMLDGKIAYNIYPHHMNMRPNKLQD